MKKLNMEKAKIAKSVIEPCAFSLAWDDQSESGSEGFYWRYLKDAKVGDVFEPLDHHGRYEVATVVYKDENGALLLFDEVGEYHGINPVLTWFQFN